MSLNYYDEVLTLVVVLKFEFEFLSLATVAKQRHVALILSSGLIL